MKGKSSSAATPNPVSISLCMIARNEEQFLAECLRSVRGVVTESIVVDTGSTDRTKRIAAEAGAKVLDFPWCDDFSAARNVGVEVATGTHILVLDADERLADKMGPNLLKAAANPDLLLGCLPLYNASEMEATFDEVLDGVKRIGDPTFVPRLFRNLPEMRFKRRVHESLTWGFNVLQAQRVGSSIAVGAALLHYGDVPSHRLGLGKDRRNELLLRKALQDDPADGEVAGYLVVDMLRQKRTREARDIGERHFSLFLERNNTRPQGFLPENMIRIGYSLGLAQIEMGRPQDAVQTTQSSRFHTPHGHPNLDFIEGLAEAALGHLDKAEELFRATRAAEGKNFAQPVLSSIRKELSQLKLAGVALARGDFRATKEELPPRSGKWTFPVDLVLAEVELEQGAAEKAMEILAQYVDRPNLPPDWHALVHRAMTELGRDADNLLQLALNAEPSSWLERRRASFVR